MQVTPLTPERLVDEVVGLVDARSGRVRVGVDGPRPTRPVELARRAAEALAALGRAAVVVDAGDFLRPASVRLEYGREDPDELLDGWLDVAGLRREVLEPAARDGSGRVLPRLWDAGADRAYRDRYVQLPDDGVVLLAGGLLLGRGLPLDAAVHLRMGEAALRRGLPPELLWTVPAHGRYARENDPEGTADLVVLADHPDRPAVRR
ncbi:uridine kinase [Pseudonocardia lacus]|uniref:uridine kinase n=1 Tax=Pseudonocardia lacus TaxID=2835865 RepID=UPI001BDD8EA0|nr:uridine kinase [Pseudonocardia lacus]